MNTKQLTPRDWQTLSAYLDGQLNERDRRGLEARLKTNAIIRQGLEEMRRTRLLLRSAPHRRAPHNFTLSQAQADAYRPARLLSWKIYPAFRLASALASILLVITFLGDFAIGTSLRTANAPVQEQAAPAAAPEMETVLQPESPTASADLNALSMPAEPASQATETPGLMMMAPQPTLNPTEEIIQRMTAAPPGMGGGIEATPAPESQSQLAPPIPTSAPAPSATPEPVLKSQAGASPYPGPGERGLDREGYGEGYPPQDISAAEPTAPAFNYRGILRPAEIALALIALITGVGALLLRRRG